MNEGASFYKSDCIQRNDNSRHYETEETFSQSSAVLASATRQMGNIRSRLDKLRISGGKRGVDISNASLNIEGTSIPVGMFGGAAGDSNELLENSRWGLFANGEYAFGDKDQGKDLIVSTGGRNFDFHSKGLTFGADYRLSGEKIILGGAIGYKDFDVDFTTQSGYVNTKGHNLSVYGTYLVSDKSYIDVILGVGKDSVDSRRPVNNDGSNNIKQKETFAIGKPSGKEFTFSVGGGYEFHQEKWSLTPYGRLDIIKGSIDAYTETTSHSSAKTSLVSINKQSIESLTSTIGVNANRVISTSKGVFMHHASIEWIHEFKGRGGISGKSLFLEDNILGLSSGFKETNRRNIDKNYFNIGAGISTVFPKGRSAYLDLKSRLGDSSIKDNAIKVGFRWEF